MNKQALNPYLPGYEYIPDAEPRVFGDRVYIYGSHDCFNGEKFCMNDYVCWSAPIDNLGDWSFEGIIYSKTQEPGNESGERNTFAPDVEQGPDGRYYLFYSMLGTVSVAVSNEPAGYFTFYGHVHHQDGTPLGRKLGDNVNFDPAILVDDEGVFLYSGVYSDAKTRDMIKCAGLMVDGAYCIELENDMITIKVPPVLVFPAKDDAYADHVFYEASSIRKINQIYYFVYSSQNGHELCYATGLKPNERFVYGGTLVSNGDVFLNGRSLEHANNYTGNTHGGMLELNGHTYIFYHRQTNLHHFSRQGCAEEIYIKDNGFIEQVEITSCGLNGKPLIGIGTYEFRNACNLCSSEGTIFYPQDKMDAGIHPFFTQDKPDGSTEAQQYISNFSNGAQAGFKYFSFDVSIPKTIDVVTRGIAHGTLKVYTNCKLTGAPAASIDISPTEHWTSNRGSIKLEKGVSPIFFTYIGTGACDLLLFTLL